MAQALANIDVKEKGLVLNVPAPAMSYVNKMIGELALSVQHTMSRLAVVLVLVVIPVNHEDLTDEDQSTVPSKASLVDPMVRTLTGGVISPVEVLRRV